MDRDVVNLDLVYDLRDTDRDGQPLPPGYKRDHLTGRVYYSARWLERARSAVVSALPTPDEALVAEAALRASEEPADPEGARIIQLQAATRPADGWIGPRKGMLGLVPTERDQLRLSGGLLVDSLRSAVRAAERLAAIAGIDSPIRANAEGAARGLTRLAERVEQETS